MLMLYLLKKHSRKVNNNVTVWFKHNKLMKCSRLWLWTAAHVPNGAANIVQWDARATDSYCLVPASSCCLYQGTTLAIDITHEECCWGVAMATLVENLNNRKIIVYSAHLLVVV